MPDTPKHYVWPPQTHCLTISNKLFDNFNTSLSPSKPPPIALSFWPSDNYLYVWILGIFCPSDFRNHFRGHSRDSKRARNWLVFFWITSNMLICFSYNITFGASAFPACTMPRTLFFEITDGTILKQLRLVSVANLCSRLKIEVYFFHKNIVE